VIEIGSSDAPVIMGVSPHLTPWQLWAQKLGMIEPPPENEAMRWGSHLEQRVAEGFIKEHLAQHIVGIKSGWTFSPHRTWHATDRKWQRATPDVIYTDYAEDRRLGLIEVKCIVGHPPSMPRIDWLIQCLHQRMVFPEAEHQYLVCYGNLHLEWWEIPRHEKAMAAVLRAEEHFLTLLETQTPRPVRAEDAGPLSKFWRATTTETVTLGADAAKWDEWYRAGAEMVKHWTDKKDEAEAHLKAMIGPAQSAVLPNGTKYTWRPQSRKGYTVEPKTIRVFRRMGGDDA